MAHGRYVGLRAFLSPSPQCLAIPFKPSSHAASAGNAEPEISSDEQEAQHGYPKQHSFAVGGRQGCNAHQRGYACDQLEITLVRRSRQDGWARAFNPRKLDWDVKRRGCYAGMATRHQHARP